VIFKETVLAPLGDKYSLAKDNKRFFKASSSVKTLSVATLKLGSYDNINCLYKPDSHKKTASSKMPSKP
jgi:hypothetical protein